MQMTNAQVLLKLDALDLGHPVFRAALTRKIVLEICLRGGVMEMRRLFKFLDVTAIAARMRLKELEEAGVLAIAIDDRNRRCKIISLTADGLRMVCDYEKDVQSALKEWAAVVGPHPSGR